MALRGKQRDEVKAAFADLQEEIQEAKEERKAAKGQLEEPILEVSILKVAVANLNVLCQVVTVH